MHRFFDVFSNNKCNYYLIFSLYLKALKFNKLSLANCSGNPPSFHFVNILSKLQWSPLGSACNDYNSSSFW